MIQKNYHFIGIKGSGMSSLATLLHDLGHRVQGSDIEEFLFTQVGLEEREIALYSFNEAPITQEMTVVIGNACGQSQLVGTESLRGVFRIRGCISVCRRLPPDD